MKILLTGCNGQVGWELARTLLPLGEVVALNREQANFLDLEKLRETVQTIRPDVIVNAAAYTAVDKAETERDLAFLINTQAVEVLAQEAKSLNALLIHYSTDYVFDGTKDAPYDEDDATNPLNVYGESKLAGEQTIQASGADYLILRTTWVFASRGQNFVKSILRLAAEREELNIVADQIGAPTWARLIAETTAHILKHAQQERVTKTFVSGIYNLTSSGKTSWHGFAEKIVELARLQNYEFKNRVINPIPTSAYPLPAKRPANSRLSTARLTQRFGLIMPTWEDTLKLCLEELK
ncbi:MAG: dTDP-4-dehydrorhamnose reductase [Methylococcales bacterium]|nr:dTDP-4-dehydrorhamnose reductase [Methylococcales bacterium]MDD5753837.1 dTDP-4-dehydrorhamnose reductase [Methylococcales bacterium]